MCVYKVKRGERGEEGSKEGEREGRSGHPTRFLPSPPPPTPYSARHSGPGTVLAGPVLCES